MTENLVGVYLLHQNWRTDKPSRHVPIEEARKMRKSGQWYSVNSGKDIAEAGQAPPETKEDAEKSRWLALPSGLPQIGYVSVLQLLT